MKNLTSRRAFIGSSVAIAAGAAVGLTASQGIRRHGPVEIRTYFFSKEPIVVKGALFSDERRDVFGFRAFVDPGVEPIVEMPLAAMRRAIDTGSSRSKVILLVTDGRSSKTARVPLAMTVEGGNVTFLIEENQGEKPTPIWLQLADVQRVL